MDLQEFLKYIMVVAALKYDGITQQVIGCTIKVHQKTKKGYTASEYQNYLVNKLSKSNLNFQQKVEMPVYYKEVIDQNNPVNPTKIP